MSKTPRTDKEAFCFTTGAPKVDGVVMADFARDLERDNAALRELAARMATEMREVDHEFASLRDYDARKEAQP